MPALYIVYIYVCVCVCVCVCVFKFMKHYTLIRYGNEFWTGVL